MFVIKVKANVLHNPISCSHFLMEMRDHKPVFGGKDVYRSFL